MSIIIGNNKVLNTGMPFVLVLQSMIFLKILVSALRSIQDDSEVMNKNLTAC